MWRCARRPDEAMSTLDPRRPFKHDRLSTEKLLKAPVDSRSRLGAIARETRADRTTERLETHVRTLKHLHDYNSASTGTKSGINERAESRFLSATPEVTRLTLCLARAAHSRHRCVSRPPVALRRANAAASWSRGQPRRLEHAREPSDGQERAAVARIRATTARARAAR